MMKIQYLLIVALIVFVQNIQSSENGITMGASDGFYWRPFNGTIPNDAFPATDKDSERPSYIGRGYVWNGGMYIGELLANATSLTVTGMPKVPIHTVTKNIEILCTTTPEMFEWVSRSEGVSLFTDLPYLVQAGYEFENDRPLLVGRARSPVMVPDSKNPIYAIKASKVTVNQPDRDKYSYMYFQNADKEGSASIYEILIVKSRK